MTSDPRPSIDPAEIAKFSAIAAEWWDPTGKFAPLHKFNPVRLAFLKAEASAHFNRDPRALRPFEGLTLLDIGCGGGLLTESMARLGAIAHGIDASAAVIEAAREHAALENVGVRYDAITAEAWAEATPTRYAAITCMELLEHVPDPASLLGACARLLQADGDLFLSTINRTPRAFATTILAAEHLLRWLPRGTHEYRRFIRPSELAGWLRSAGFEVVTLTGMRYLPLSRRAELASDVGVNYLIHARRRG